MPVWRPACHRRWALAGSVRKTTIKRTDLQPGEQVSVRTRREIRQTVNEEATDAVHEAGVLRLAIDRARAELGWWPRWRLEETLQRTARWYRSVERDPAAAREECLADIRAYPF